MFEYQFTRRGKVNDSLRHSGIQCLVQTSSEVWGTGATKAEFPRSVFRGKPPMREERWCGQMSKAISVRPDKLQLGYHLLLWAWSRAGAKTMPTPLCDDQCLRRLCKMAAAMPMHYYESLALQFFFFFFSSSEEVPSVSDSGASAIYFECSKQSCHFCILGDLMLPYHHYQACLSWKLWKTPQTHESQLIRWRVSGPSAS